ncbi:MAG TPA: hypothetical protein VFB14_24110 [Bryobacteraceae bacterium]|jgi:hypothetical protein|nr:hypothetical protein [Bryobacteraceae bacterium]
MFFALSGLAGLPGIEVEGMVHPFGNEKKHTMRTTKFDATAEAFAPEPPAPSSHDAELQNSNHHIAAKGFAQMFGLHPAMAFLTLIVDTMLFGAEAGSLGATFVISLAASVVLGVITYRAQIKWFDDDNESALLKACILAFLTAIPTPLPGFVYVPAGVVGAFHTLRRK